MRESPQSSNIKSTSSPCNNSTCNQLYSNIMIFSQLLFYYSKTENKSAKPFLFNYSVKFWSQLEQLLTSYVHKLLF